MSKANQSYSNWAVGLAAVLALISGPGAKADAVAEFYKGKTVRLVIGTAVGGAYDIHGRTVGRHIARHIPAGPRLIVQNKKGAGSQIAAGYVFGVAPQDGTVIGALLNTLPMRQAIGLTRKTFDVDKFQWVGNLTNDVSVLTLWNTATKARTVEDIRKMEVVTGATSATSLGATIPKAMNHALGTKFKVVTGYKGGLAVDQALEKGEVAARAGANWSVLRGKYPHWIKNNQITVVVQIGSHRAEGLEKVPLMHELGRTEEEHLILEFFSTAMDVGKPFAVGPKVPTARVAALRAAFDAMVKDPAFLADAKKQGLLISPVRGADLQNLVAKIVATPPNTIKAAKKIFGKPKKGKKKKKK
jgi:tripartite-type tricarboxylate transporter receptor subunit TctC